MVLIEDCLDEDDDEEGHIIRSKSSSDGLVNLFSTGSERPAAKSGPALRKATTSHNIKFSALNNNNNSNPKLSNAQPSLATNANEDDPYVKAALERFDAFCKSKSTLNLEQTSSLGGRMSQRQKSPFLARKTITQPDDEPSLKDNLGSFIKRRQTRIEPTLKQEGNTNMGNCHGYFLII